MYNQNKRYVVAVVVLLFLITFAGYSYRQRALETARGTEPALSLGQIAGNRRSHFAADRSD